MIFMNSDEHFQHVVVLYKIIVIIYIFSNIYNLKLSYITHLRLKEHKFKLHKIFTEKNNKYHIIIYFH